MKKPPQKFACVIRKVGDNLKPIPINNGLQDYLNLRFKEDDKVSMTIKKFYNRRTTGREGYDEGNQNGYLWTVVLPYLCEYFGYLPDEMLDALRPLFFYEVHDKDPNIKRLLSTTQYDTKDWEDKMEQIRIWALTEHDIKIPLPNEVETGDN